MFIDQITFAGGDYLSMPQDIFRAAFCKSALQGTYMFHEILFDKIKRK